MPLNPRLRSCVDLLQTCFLRGPAGFGWTQEIRRVVDDLENLNRVTESDFLKVGGNLMAFLTASRRLHGDVARLTVLVSGEHAQQACDALGEVRRYAEEMQRRSEQSGGVLAILQAGSERIRRGFAGFFEIALSFRITAILARMEAAHLATSRQNLRNLADDVRSCSDGIRTCADRVLEVAGDFNARVTSTLPAVSRFRAVQVHELPALLAAVDADLEIFQGRRREAARISLVLAESQDAVARELGVVAGSIQFHDITRQQIEHVIEALRGLLRTDSEGAISSSGAALVGVQKAQLENAAAAFTRSTQQIDSNLEAISAGVADMAAAGKGIDELAFNGAPESPDSFWKDMQRRFAALAQAVSELDSLERGTRSVVAELRHTGAALGAAVEDVQLLEKRLGFISINAIISACQIGPGGEALKVIADVIGNLKTESASRSADAETALDSIGEAVASLAAGRSADDGEKTGAALLAKLGTSAADLESTSISCARTAAGIAAVVDTLCADLQRARHEFRIGRLFAETVSRCCDSLVRVAAQARPEQSAAEPPPVHTRESLYTMQAERDVHWAATVGSAPPAAAQSLSEAAEEVEFF